MNTLLFGEQSEMVGRCFAELQAKTTAHVQAWGLDTADWNADLPRGQIEFSGPVMRATASMQIIGTYNTLDGSWLWGWDHPSVPPELGQHARLVRAFAEGHGLTHLLSRSLDCTELDAWAFVALACHLGQAQGAYRGPAGSTLVFMTFGQVQLTSAPHSTTLSEA